jgi:hypothetical protein
MVIKAAPRPLSNDEVGIDVLSNGVWHETTLADVTADQSNRIFGFVDVPVLDDDERYGIAAFDNTRNGTLNRLHPVVTALLYWIQEEVKNATKILQDEVKQRKKTEDAKRLREQAKEIARVLNDDFKEVIEELDELRQIAGRRRQNVAQGDGVRVLPGEGDQSSELSETGPEHANGTRGETPAGSGDTDRPGAGLKEGKSKGSPGSLSSHSGRRRSQGLFSIEFNNETESERRSRYDHDLRTIYVNLDHPQIAAALKLGEGSVASVQFRQIAFEVATVEYAQALQFERVNSGEKFDAADAVFSIGEVIDRVTRRVAVFAE